MTVENVCHVCVCVCVFVYVHVWRLAASCVIREHTLIRA
jgi:hypothetical protein